MRENPDEDLGTQKEVRRRSLKCPLRRTDECDPLGKWLGRLNHSFRFADEQAVVTTTRKRHRGISAALSLSPPADGSDTGKPSRIHLHSDLPEWVLNVFQSRSSKACEPARPPMAVQFSPVCHRPSSPCGLLQGPRRGRKLRAHGPVATCSDTTVAQYLGLRH